MEPRLQDELMFLLKKCKEEATYVSNHDLAVAITTALDDTDAEEIADKVLDIIDFSRE
jgi:hypothetical protein